VIEPYYADASVALHLGDCRDVLPTLADASVDAIVCDPPYEINFMSRGWDSTGIAYDVDMWRQCLRVLKPGGHLLAFGATRTYHRLTVAIEDAGFEIRDSIHWIFGSGFPKGQDVAKSIDRKRDDRADVLVVTAWLANARDAAGLTNRAVDDALGFNGMARHWTASGMTAQVPSAEQWKRLRDFMAFDDSEILPLVENLNARKGILGEAWGQREVLGRRHSGLSEGGTSVFLGGTTGRDADGTVAITAPASAAAKDWQGWNTALKPAHEPIVLARKSTGFNTAVANVLQHGTGALNIDGCRIEAGQDYRDKCASVVGLDSNRNGDTLGEWTGVREDSAHDAGRWPTNVLLGHGPDCDGGECGNGCPIADLDLQSGVRRAGAHPAQRAGIGYGSGAGGTSGNRVEPDSGGASRFFPTFRYRAKAPASERPRLADGTTHATVKPLDLMRWLVRLVAPPGGTVLDHFAGSGTTLEACVIEGFHAIGIEREPDHAELCVTRLSKPIQQTLDGAA
jgi:hypothetical protein